MLLYSQCTESDEKHCLNSHDGLMISMIQTNITFSDSTITSVQVLAAQVDDRLT
jgi:hypothetical protein